MYQNTQQRRRIRGKKSNVSGLIDGQNSKDLIRGSNTKENSTKRFFILCIYLDQHF